MTDDEFEKATASWLAQRGYLIQKMDKVGFEFMGAEVEAFVLPEAPETPLDRPESRFDEFWALYPRKTGKEAARKIFEKLDLGSQNNATRGLRRHLEADAFSNEKCYIKHPSTWLNQKVYLDDPETRAWRKPQIGGKTDSRNALDDWLNSDG